LRCLSKVDNLSFVDNRSPEAAMSWIIAPAAALLLVLLLAAALAVLGAVRARRSEGGGVAGAALVVAAATAAIAAIGGVVTVLIALLSPQVGITVPVAEHWPTLPDGAIVEGMTATRVAGGFTSADLVVEGLSVAARVCWAIAQGLAWFVPGAIAALVALACTQLRAGRPFAALLPRMTMLTAVIVLLGGTAAQVLGDVAGSMAAHEALAWSGAQWHGDLDPTALLPSPAVRVELPSWPIGAALGLAALAGILRHGGRLARDTEGLV
jgi:hypothetical protein